MQYAEKTKVTQQTEALQNKADGQSIPAIPKTCSNCKKCTTCTFAGRSITQKERIKLEYIDRGISNDKENNVFRIKYPFLEDPREALTDNRSQALAYETSLEKV